MCLQLQQQRQSGEEEIWRQQVDQAHQQLLSQQKHRAALRRRLQQDAQRAKQEQLRRIAPVAKARARLYGLATLDSDPDITTLSEKFGRMSQLVEEVQQQMEVRYGLVGDVSTMAAVHSQLLDSEQQHCWNHQFNQDANQMWPPTQQQLGLMPVQQQLQQPQTQQLQQQMWHMQQYGLYSEQQQGFGLTSESLPFSQQPPPQQQQQKVSAAQQPGKVLVPISQPHHEERQLAAQQQYAQNLLQQHPGDQQAAQQQLRFS
jgi:hypothetical protein